MNKYGVDLIMTQPTLSVTISLINIAEIILDPPKLEQGLFCYITCIHNMYYYNASAKPFLKASKTDKFGMNLA